MNRVARCALAVLVGAALSSMLAGAGCILARSGALEQTCSVDGDCDDATDCTFDRCAADGLCEHVAFDGSRSLLQVPFDCKRLACRQGRAVAEADDGDKPANPCIDASCTDGELLQSNRPDGTGCTLGAGSGHCEGGECVVKCDPMQPMDPVCNDGNACTLDACDAALAQCVRDELDNVLVKDHVPSYTDDPTGDCLVDLCVLGILQADVFDDADVLVDPDECTLDVCSAGMPLNPPLPENTPCGTGGALFCDAFGNCVNCTSAAQCLDPDPYDCIVPACEQLECGIASSDDGQPCEDGVACNGADSCIGGACDQHGGNPCPGQDVGPDCSDSCDPANGQCTYPDLSGTSCDDGSFCTGSESCQSGVCNSTGNPCPGQGVAPPCNDACDDGTLSCTGNDPDGLACGTLRQCQSGACQVACGTTLATPAGCHASCTGGCVSGTCIMDCSGANACQNTTITCPLGRPCEIRCTGPNACQNATITCAANNHTCTVACSGPNACDGVTTINCPTTGVCSVGCAADNCEGASVNCSASLNNCNVMCGGAAEPVVNCNGVSTCSCIPC